jgi:hypothetical protein
MGDQLLVALSTSAILSQLVCLDFSSTRGITAEGLGALVAALRPGALKRLALYLSPLGDEAVQPLAESPTMAGVMRISLQSTGIGDAGVEAFLGSPFLEAGGSLILKDNRISRRVVRLLSRRYDRVVF